MSAIGALCHGTHAAAIGTTTALRHVYPRPKPGAGGAGNLSHLRACGCTACGGRLVDHFATTDEPTRAAGSSAPSAMSRG